MSFAASPGLVPPPPSGSKGDRAQAGIAHGFIAVFAFLLASFPARNPEIWQHLAAGRDLAHGRFPGADGRLGPAWLFDLSAHAAYSAGGGAGIVVVKAVLIAGLGVLLLRLGRTRPGWVIPGLCAGLAILATSVRVLLQPGTVAYLFFGLTLWLLRPRAEGRRFGWLPPWPLVAVFLAWANTDRGFVVGLGVVAAVMAGRTLDEPSAGRLRAAGRRSLGVAVLAAVCLLNPEHFHAFGLPPEWRPGTQGSGGLRAVVSPFDRGYLDFAFESPAGLAYFPLLGLSLFSFALTVREWRWERFLPWAALAALSAFQVRAIPFFAILAGPTLAANLQTFFWRTRQVGSVAPRRRLDTGVLAVIFGLAFLAAAWPGWLQGPPFEPRRWAVETPPSLRAGAAAVCEWRAARQLGPSAGGLHLSPDTAAAFAWFCPTDRAVNDPDLLAEALGRRPTRTDWADRMRAAGVTHVVMYETDRQRRAEAFGRLLADPEQWPLVILEGGVAVFDWRDPARLGYSDPFARVETDLDRRALRPGPGETAPPAAASVPRRWWEAFWKRAPVPAADRDAAFIYLLQAEGLRRSALVRHASAWEATQAIGLIGSAAGWVGPTALVDADQRLSFLHPLPTGPGTLAGPLDRLAVGGARTFVREREDSPAAALYLAIRTARRAVAADPQDAPAYVALGEAYLRLVHNSRERVWGRQLAELVQLRRAQAAAALHRAIAIDPNAADAHLQLGALYSDMGFLDLALEHRRAYVEQVRRAARTAPADVRAAVRAEEERLDVLANDVDARRRQFDAEASDLRVLDRAVRARELGLAGRARDILLASDISAFGAAGVAQELELLVRTGRPQEVLDWTAPEHREALGGRFHWLRAQAFAAVGDYLWAEEECVQLGVGPEDAGGTEPRAAMAGIVAQHLMNGQLAVRHVGLAAWSAFAEQAFWSRLGQLVTAIRRDADARALRGLLALEEGNIDVAAAQFRDAVAIWGSDSATAEGSGIDFNGRPLAAGGLAWIESVHR